MSIQSATFFFFAARICSSECVRIRFFPDRFMFLWYFIFGLKLRRAKKSDNIICICFTFYNLILCAQLARFVQCVPHQISKDSFVRGVFIFLFFCMLNTINDWNQSRFDNLIVESKRNKQNDSGFNSILIKNSYDVVHFVVSIFVSFAFFELFFFCSILMVILFAPFFPFDIKCFSFLLHLFVWSM